MLHRVDARLDDVCNVLHRLAAQSATGLVVNATATADAAAAFEKRAAERGLNLVTTVDQGVQASTVQCSVEAARALCSDPRSAPVPAKKQPPPPSRWVFKAAAWPVTAVVRPGVHCDGPCKIVNVVPNNADGSTVGEFVVVYKDVADMVGDDRLLRADYLWSAATDASERGIPAMWFGPTTTDRGKRTPVLLEPRSTPETAGWRAMRASLGDINDSSGELICYLELHVVPLDKIGATTPFAGWYSEVRSMFAAGEIVLYAKTAQKFCKIDWSLDRSDDTVTVTYMDEDPQPSDYPSGWHAGEITVANVIGDKDHPRPLRNLGDKADTHSHRLFQHGDDVFAGNWNLLASVGFTPAGQVLAACVVDNDLRTVECVAGPPARLVTRCYTRPRGPVLDGPAGGADWLSGLNGARIVHRLASVGLGEVASVAVVYAPELDHDAVVVTAEGRAASSVAGVTLVAHADDVPKFKFTNTKTVRVLDVAVLPDLPLPAGDNLVVLRSFDAFRGAVRGLALWGCSGNNLRATDSFVQRTETASSLARDKAPVLLEKGQHEQATGLLKAVGRASVVVAAARTANSGKTIGYTV